MDSNWETIYPYIIQLEEEGLVTGTFRRLDPERQQAIINAILEEAIEKGPIDLNIKRVAQRAQVSVGALYTYFPDRERMLAFIIELCLRFMRDEFDHYRAYFTGLPFDQAFDGYLSGGLAWSELHANIVRFFARAAYHSDSQLGEQLVQPIATTMWKMVIYILEQAAARGELKDDIDLEATAHILHALSIAVSDAQLLPYLNHYYQITGEKLPAKRMNKALLDLIQTGIRRSNQ